jgi:hypothetical protein
MRVCAASDAAGHRGRGSVTAFFHCWRCLIPLLAFWRLTVTTTNPRNNKEFRSTTVAAVKSALRVPQCFRTIGVLWGRCPRSTPRSFHTKWLASFIRLLSLPYWVQPCLPVARIARRKTVTLKNIPFLCEIKCTDILGNEITSH